MRGYVLQAGQVKRIGVRVMTVVAHQGALLALRQVVLVRGETVVDEDGGPPAPGIEVPRAEHARERTHETGRHGMYLGHIAERQSLGVWNLRHQRGAARTLAKHELLR